MKANMEKFKLGDEVIVTNIDLVDVVWKEGVITSISPWYYTVDLGRGIGSTFVQEDLTLRTEFNDQYKVKKTSIKSTDYGDFVYKYDEFLRAIKLYIPDKYLDKTLPLPNMLMEGVKRMEKDCDTLEIIKNQLKDETKGNN